MFVIDYHNVDKQLCYHLVSLPTIGCHVTFITILYVTFEEALQLNSLFKCVRYIKTQILS